jgi:hypothetical protein
LKLTQDNHELHEALIAVEWQLVGRPTRVRGIREWWVTVLGSLCSVALHSLVLAPLIFGTDARVKRAPEQEGLGSSAVVGSAEMVSTLTFIALSPAITSIDEALPAFASRGIAEPKFELMVASPDPNLAFDVDEEVSEEEDRESVTETAAGVGPERAMLFGRYMGQVDARIQRAWMRPRTPIGARRFECQTRIEQDKSGNVLSVELLNCNGDARWQQSLVNAIQRASPLSAPPEPSVFTATVLLSFDATEYQPDVSIESEYEPDVQLADVMDTVPLQVVTNRDKTLDDVRKHQGNVELTIIGKETTWTLKDAEERASSPDDLAARQ